MSKRGIGFFEAGNFYPDFILWLLVGKKHTSRSLTRKVLPA